MHITPNQRDKINGMVTVKFIVKQKYDVIL